MIAVLLFSEIIVTVIFIVFACHLLGPQLFSNKILVLVFGEQTVINSNSQYSAYVKLEDTFGRD